jgi:hypothetical protein
MTHLPEMTATLSKYFGHLKSVHSSEMAIAMLRTDDAWRVERLVNHAHINAIKIRTEWPHALSSLPQHRDCHLAAVHTLQMDEDQQRPLSSYLVGPALDDALTRDDSNSIEVFWPFEVR